MYIKLRKLDVWSLKAVDINVWREFGNVLFTLPRLFFKLRFFGAGGGGKFRKLSSFIFYFADEGISIIPGLLRISFLRSLSTLRRCDSNCWLTSSSQKKEIIVQNNYICRKIFIFLFHKSTYLFVFIGCVVSKFF